MMEDSTTFAAATNNNHSLHLETRLKTARRVIREATTAAQKFVQTDQTVIGNDNDTNTNNATKTQMHNTMHMHRHSTEAEEFDLAMMLFGDDVRGIEEDINMKLTKVEHDLYSYFQGKQEYHQYTTHQHQVAKSAVNHFDYEEKDEDMNMHMNMHMHTSSSTSAGETQMNVDDTSLLETEAKQLSVKINFLKKCSEARVALDDVSTGFLQASVSKGSMTSPRSFSPSSGSGSASSNNNSTCTLVDIAQHLNRAKKALAEAKQFLQSSSVRVDSDIMKSQDTKIGQEFIDSIQSQIRRKNVDVYAKACEIFTSCITIDNTSISICEGPGLSLSKKSVFGDDGGDAKDDTNNKVNEKSGYEGLKVALDVLAILSEDGSRKLENTIANVADEVCTVILRPVILETRKALDTSKGRGGGDEAADILNSSWEFHESQVQVRRGGIKTSSTSSSFASKTKGLVSTLEWKKCEPTTIMEVDHNNNNNSSSSSKSNSGGDLTWWTNLLEFIQTITKFIVDKVLSQREDISLMYGKATFGNVSSTKNPYSLSFDETVMEHGDKCPIMKLLGRTLWYHCIPESPSDTTIDDFSNVRKIVVESTHAFETFLQSAGLTENPTPLAEYGNCYEDKYNEKVRTMILGKGRSILLESDYHNSVTVGVNVHEKRKANRAEYMDHIDLEDNDMSEFVLEECAISQVALNLFDLCKETMDLAVKPQSLSYSPLLPAALFRSSRELFDLFRAVIPAAHGREIAAIPRTAAIFHNDCVYFANKLLTFGLKYRDEFTTTSQEEGKESESNDLKKICTYLDMVPIFRELAEHAMNDMIRHQKVQISEIISPRIEYLTVALGSSEGVVEWTEAETALTAGLYHLRHLSQNWKIILSHDVYCRTMGGLVDALFSLYLDKVLAAKDISVSACHFVSALFRDALRGVTELFGSGPSPSSDEAAKEAKRFCEFEDKFSAIGRFMDMSLADITMSLSEGVFQSVTGAELSRLVMAVFEDSGARAQLLRLLDSN